MSDTMPQIEQLASLLGERLQGVWDALDIAEIDRIGYDPARYARVTAAYEAMRIACVAYGE